MNIFNKKEPDKSDKSQSIFGATGSLFFIILVVFAFKSTILDANNIPSASMIPTLKIGDFLFVNKMRYSIRYPFTEIELYRFDEPKRGDIITFNPPETEAGNFFLNENDKNNLKGMKKWIFVGLSFFEETTGWPMRNMFSKKFVKRLVGMPGDTFRLTQKQFKNERGNLIYYTFIEFKDKTMDNFESYHPVLMPVGKELHDLDDLNAVDKTLFQETKNNFKHLVIEGSHVGVYSFIENSCSRINGLCKIPEGHYMAMGDNRDNSHDSRFFGFIKREDILGKALLIYFSINWKDNTCQFKNLPEGQDPALFREPENQYTEEEALKRCHPSELYGNNGDESILGWIGRTLRYRIWRMDIRWSRIARILE